MNRKSVKKYTAGTLAVLVACCQNIEVLPFQLLTQPQTVYAAQDQDSDFVIEDGVLTSYIGKDEDVVIPEEVTAIGDYAFWECVNVKSITIPEGVTTIGDVAFGDCESLEEIVLPDTVTEIGDFAFQDCKSLKSIALPEDLITIGTFAFCTCESLEEVVIPENVWDIGFCAFWGCTSLQNIEVSEENMFYCSEDGILYDGFMSTLISCPAGKEGTVAVPELVFMIGDSAFAGCDKLEQIELSEDVCYIGEDAFEDCASLTAIEVASENIYYTSEDGVLYNEDMTELIFCPQGKRRVNVPEGVEQIGDYAFEECLNLLSVTLPEGLTSIGNYAFFSCTGLVDITLPTTLVSIGKGAFFGCNRLYDVYYNGSKKAWSDVSVAAQNDELLNAYYTYMEEDECLYGDANEDGVVDLKDVTLMRRILTGWNVAFNEEQTDVDVDGDIDLKDVALVKRYAAGWDVTLGPESA